MSTNLQTHTYRITHSIQSSKYIDSLNNFTEVTIVTFKKKDTFFKRKAEKIKL